VIVLEKIPHPYYIDRRFVLLSYLEQGLVDYRAVNSVPALDEAARRLGAPHVPCATAGPQGAGIADPSPRTAPSREAISKPGTRAEPPGKPLRALRGAGAGDRRRRPWLREGNDGTSPSTRSRCSAGSSP